MLKEFREKLGISQEKLSETTNIDRKTIFRIENDISSPLIENYAKIVIALQLTDNQIANHIREIAINKYKQEKNLPYDEKECIYYITGNYCSKDNAKETCCICKDKQILKEGETIGIAEEYTLTRKNGRIIKKIEYQKKFDI